MESEILNIPLEQLDVSLPDQLDADEIDQLCVSIREDGLLHPLTVYPKDGRYVVDAGRKRYIALQKLGFKNIKCLVLSPDLTVERRKEVALRENLVRFNLPWYDQVVMQAELFAIRQAQHGKGTGGRPRGGERSGFSLRDMAQELGRGLGTISEDMRLAEAVMANPNLRKIKDKITAKRLVFHELKRIETEVEAGMTKPHDMPLDVALLGESSAVLSNFPDRVFDAVITDPPWLEYKDESLTADDKTLSVFSEVYRVMKMGSFLYMFVSTADFILYSTELPKIGFKLQQMPLIWVKEGVITHGMRSWEYARDYEPILLAVKGVPVLTTSSQLSAIFSFPVVHSSKLIHPNEKPIALIQKIISHCTYENSVILDPFAGSGVIGDAAIKTKRHFVLIEREKKFFDNIEKRLKDL